MQLYLEKNYANIYVGQVEYTLSYLSSMGPGEQCKLKGNENAEISFNINFTIVFIIVFYKTIKNQENNYYLISSDYTKDVNMEIKREPVDLDYCFFLLFLFSGSPSLILLIFSSQILIREIFGFLDIAYMSLNLSPIYIPFPSPFA